MNELIFPFVITLLAGATTGIGGLVVLFTKKTNLKMLSVCLSFAAGVMIYVSFTEIFLKSLEFLEDVFYEGHVMLVAVIAFFVGIALIALIDKLLPHDDEGAAFIHHSVGEKGNQKELSPQEEKALHRTGIMSALAIAIHNFPEGLVTFLAALYDPALGIAIAIAISIHNIPEGIAMAAPIYYATGSKKKAFFISAISGLTEPIGALVGYFVLLAIFDEAIMGVSFAAVGGIMVFIGFHQLLPTSHRYGDHHTVMKGLFAGMLVMAISIVLLEL